ncbi:putative NADPH-quinone reductase [Sphaerotilus mobilis]|uniref:Putative NADPH-quinone reductase n=1 Tax=Sphaerotilus mobilis TaxID=47994 RepID=A0A4Q7LCJ1_9BURK|nr:putative NADPH-quinone reductase [Sphaerotilus mobilis]
MTRRGSGRAARGCGIDLIKNRRTSTVKILLLWCHPDPNSYSAALRQTAADALREAGHELREVDLYALHAQGQFDPVLSPDEKRSYLVDTDRNIAAVQPHVDALRWAEGWVVVYPTWMYGPPALLKGWLDRVFLPGVSFGLGGSRHRPIVGALTNIRWFCGITTSGSPWWWLRWIGDPGRRLFLRGLKPLYARGCRTTWLQLHAMNYASHADRSRFLARVRHTLSRVRA